jgi:taurine transport system substrate-binding protein
MKRILFAIGLALVAATLASLAKAAENAVTIGYQTTIEPAKVAIADGLYEKATGWKGRNGPAVLTKPAALANSG